MATETVQPTTHEEGTNGDLAELGAQSSNNADQEKQQIASVLVGPENALDPRGATEAPVMRHLGESSSSLSLNDFELSKTLGTGI